MKPLRCKSPIRRFTRWFAMFGLAWIVLSSPGCASNVVERDLYDHNETTTLLRSHLDNNEPLDRGFQHPIQISEERLRRILSSLHVRVDQRFRDPIEKPAVAPDIVARVARALSESLETADSSEEVALLAVRKSRRLGLFTERTLTSFVAYVKDDRLTIALNRVDWNLSNIRSSAYNRKKLPKPRLGEKQMDFRLVQSPDYEAAGAQAAAVRFADAKWDVPGAAVVSKGDSAKSPAESEPAAEEGASDTPAEPVTETP